MSIVVGAHYDLIAKINSVFDGLVLTARAGVTPITLHTPANTDGLVVRYQQGVGHYPIKVLEEDPGVGLFYVFCGSGPGVLTNGWMAIIGSTRDYRDGNQPRSNIAGEAGYMFGVECDVADLPVCVVQKYINNDFFHFYDWHSPPGSAAALLAAVRQDGSLFTTQRIQFAVGGSDPGSVVDAAYLFCEDISPGNGSLAVRQEAAVAVAAAVASTHKWPIRINGTTYYVLLSNV